MTSVPAASLGPLVGRDAELARAEELLASGARLLVLLGPPGMGKTRLAQELVLRSSARGASDALWIDLAQVESADALASRLAFALDVRTSWIELQPATPSATRALPAWIDELAWALEARADVTLVLDEVDAVARELGPLLVALLAAAPHARALVTSRERLGVADETPLELGPLATEGIDGPSDAARLLALRAGLTPNDAEADALDRLARALDGVPLALELAAASLQALGPGELLARLPTLLEGATGATLRDALDASWRRLRAPERRALASCAVFRGPFDLDAAEVVIGVGAADELRELRHRSLVAREGSRFRLYASVRQLAAAHAELAPDARDRHRACFVARARAELDAHGRGDASAGARLVACLDELEHASMGASPTERTTLLLAIATARVGRVASPELVDRLERALLESPDEAAAIHALRARLLEAAGRMDEAVAAFGAAITHLSSGAGSIDRELDHEVVRRVEARSTLLTELAHAELARGDVATAAEHAREALELAAPSSLAKCRAARVVGLVAHARGQLDEARDAYVDALDRARALGLDPEVAGLRADLGGLRLQQRRLEEAREDYEAALAGLDPELDPIRRGLAEGNLAILEQEEGQPARAAELYARATERLQRAGHRLYTAHLQVYAGALAHEHDRPEDAARLYDAARSSLRRVGDARLLALASGLAGALEAQRGRVAAAKEAFEESDRALTRVDDAGVARSVELHRAHLSLAKGSDEALALLRALEGSEPMASSDDLRLAARLLRRRIGHGSLRVTDEARALVLPDGTHVELGSRLVLWRLVSALVALRERAPGEPLAIDAAIEAGWPGERMTGDSANNRLKVALSTLRKLGLRELLVRHESGGYLLDPNVPISHD
ncbi:MAG: AAA family ATPase [Myxococcota bacterium]|jgi:tetratricopeptide (TPR) repeat protein|nr:AAA family ATPase [Myxococcota bacterium]